MTKKIILSSLIFFACTLVFTAIFFPYSAVLEFYATKAVARSGLNLTVGKTEASAFGASFTNVKLNDFRADSISFSYSPISVITRKLGIKLVSDTAKGEGTVKGSAINLRTMLSLDKIPQVASSGLKGDIILNLALEDMNGVGTIESAALSIPTDMGPLTLKNLTGTIAVEKQMISITNLKSTGSTAVDLRGNIRVNSSNAGKSTIAVTGNLSVAGMTKKLAVTGNILDPKVILAD